MGKQISKIADAQAFLHELRYDFLEDRLFELGESQEILTGIKNNFDSLYKLLNELNSYYTSIPFKDRNSYYEAKRITKEVQGFLDDVGLSAVGDVNKTRKLGEYVQELESILENLPVIATSTASPEIEIEKPFPVSFPQSTIDLAEITKVDSAISRQPKQVIQPKRSRFRSFIIKFNTNTMTPLGALFFDIIGRKPQTSTSPLIIGWILLASILLIITLVTTFVILLLNGSIRVEQLIKIWQLFIPPKAP